MVKHASNSMASFIRFYGFVRQSSANPFADFAHSRNQKIQPYYAGQKHGDNYLDKIYRQICPPQIQKTYCQPKDRTKKQMEQNDQTIVHPPCSIARLHPEKDRSKYGQYSNRKKQ